MIDVMKEKASYLSTFRQLEKELARHSRPALQRLRKAAIARFDDMGFPGPRDEDWKFTNLAPLARLSFAPVHGYERNGLSLKKLQQVAFGLDEGIRLAFVNGHYAADLSSAAGLPNGVVVSSLAAAFEAHPEIVEAHLARHASYERRPFTALNTALFQDGAFLFVPKNVVVEQPIHLLYVSTASGEPTMSHPRNLVVVGSNSQVRLVESYLGLGDDTYFTNAITEIIAADNAVIDHYKVQQESESAFHVATTQIHQDRTSNFSSLYIGLGGRLVRNEVRVVLDAEGCECTLNGLYVAGNQQHMDNFTVIDHARAHCASHELYKGILDGKAHGVFNGKIFVHQDAQKTDAKQTNQTLLLSDDATINTKPQLEIYADDVKCTHGATVGQLDAESIFYLRSRGIGAQEARSLLTFAFANDIVSRIKLESLRAQLEEFLLETQHLSEGQAGKEEL